MDKHSEVNEQIESFNIWMINVAEPLPYELTNDFDEDELS